MISSLYNGLSGLDSFQKALNVESNNIANVNTVGFKSDRISFADMMYQNDIGKGSIVQTIDKDFTNGSYQQTGNSYDVAINGDGFFVVNDPNTAERFFTRAGNFKQDVNGFLITAGGMNVQGHQSTVTGDTINHLIHTKFVASQVIEGDTQLETVNARTTDYVSSAEDDIDPDTGRVIKTKESKLANIEALITNYQQALQSYAKTQEAGAGSTTQTNTVSFPDFATQLALETDLVTIEVNGKQYSQEFDTDAQTTMQKLAEQISSAKGVDSATFDAATGTLSINGVVPGQSFKVQEARINDVVANITTVDAIKGSGEANVQTALAALEKALAGAGAELVQNTTVVNTAQNIGQTLPALTDIKLNVADLGLSTDQFSSLDIIDGIIYMSQGDNKFAIGRIQTAEFINPHGLDPQGSNLFVDTSASGDPLDSTNSSALLSKTLELSNSELSENLVNLMVFQRAYEANSKSITTSDEFLNIAIQLKR